MVASVIIARVKTSENEPSNQDICITLLDDSKKNFLNLFYAENGGHTLKNLRKLLSSEQRGYHYCINAFTLLS